jgi:hypothetical protein
MMKVGDTVADTFPRKFEDEQPIHNGIVWNVTAVEPNDDGSFAVTLERDDNGKTVVEIMQQVIPE